MGVDATGATRIPLRQKWKTAIKNNVTDPTETTSAKITKGVLAGTKIGQAIQGSLLDKQPVRDMFTRGFGVNFEKEAKNVQITGKKLTEKNIEALEKAGVSKETIGILKGSNKARLNTNGIVGYNNTNLADLIQAKGTAALKNSGVTLAAKDGGVTISKTAGKELTENQLKILKNMGISDNVVKELGEKGTAVIQKGTVDELIKTAGRKELAQVAKDGGVKIQEITTRSIRVGTEGAVNKLAKNITEKVAGTGIVKKVAGWFGAKVDAKVAGEAASKLVGKVGAVGAKGFAGIPVVGALIMGAFEIPNIVKAFKKEGLAGGLKEAGRATIKVGTSLVGGAVGAVVGSALLPVGGTLIGDAVGGIAGYSLGEKFANGLLGKSEAQKEEDAEAKGINIDPRTNPFGGTVGRMTTKVLN